MTPLTDDVLIIRLVDGTFSVSVVRGKSLGRTSSEQDALALAFSHSRGHRVWRIDRSGGLVVVHRPVESAQETPDDT